MVERLDLGAETLVPSRSFSAELETVSVSAAANDHQLHQSGAAEPVGPSQVPYLYLTQAVDLRELSDEQLNSELAIRGVPIPDSAAAHTRMYREAALFPLL